ncbi:FAD-dependent oxidoreductase [Pseudoalteromonas sp. XMcav2-N-2]|uniref:FAD-dependent oxidoreductase n=1 Tax=unclassified Pseudoalteromonas TaxID=194690 RepID=UPI0020978CF9|nr:FAD-dependent oxidoreductase [Pseudoalteromonas sp. XMcav2-N]
MSNKYDCVIVGGGISGTVTAWQLFRQGLKVVIVDPRSAPVMRLAESMPASAEPMMHRLGLLELLQQEPHSMHSGQISSWGEPVLREAPLSDRHHGWKVDKSVLTTQIQTRLPEKCLFNGKVVEVSEHDDVWFCRVKSAQDGSEHSLESRFIVDASGRQGYLPRVLNLPRHTFDKLTAFVANVPSPFNLKGLSPSVVVEAFEHGWTLISRLNAEQSMLAIFCNQHTPGFSQLKHSRNWHDIAVNTPCFYNALPEQPFTVKAINASSHIMGRLNGKNWLLAGDAAMAFDPLSSHGMTTAIYMAEKASQAILAALNGETTALHLYSKSMTEIYNSYLNELFGYYRREQRFPDSEFWRSKQGIQQPEVRNVIG